MLTRTALSRYSIEVFFSLKSLHYLRTWKSTIFAAFLIYVSIQITVQINPNCQSANYSMWTVYATIYHLGTSTACIVMQVSNFVSDPLRRNIASMSVSSGIVLLNALSSVLILFGNWGGVCQDALGYYFAHILLQLFQITLKSVFCCRVETPGAIWAECKSLQLFISCPNIFLPCRARMFTSTLLHNTLHTH